MSADSANRAVDGIYIEQFSIKAYLKEAAMARKYSKASSEKVAEAMRERKAGTLRSGRSGKRVKSRKQAIAIGLSEARQEGKKVPKRKTRS
jgi:hypothetical protein